ncbi:TBC1 domain family member 10B-like [Bufo bufo]|uniref:TBC1 domain family member 10B-like n=1 Tax=Bufo bufo TaxID=8384 RepID=UPI001ABDA756|nr:TBC1 domain family member 10B-like [Bufo bufo]
MESPPGPCSSPPGPRPVPPPRKGSMERRPLSPLRRGAEHLGAGDAAGDVSARGSIPGAPERATVTQRVLIVMQSHAGSRTAAGSSHGPAAPENTPITTWGPERPPPVTPVLDQGEPPTPDTQSYQGPLPIPSTLNHAAPGGTTSGITQGWALPPPHSGQVVDIGRIARDPEADRTPPNGMGAQDCSTAPSQDGEGTPIPQDMGRQVDLLSQDVCENDAMLTDGASQSIAPLHPQNISPEDVKSALSVRPEDVKSAPSVRPEDVKSAPAIRPEDVKSAPSVRPEDVKSAPPVRPEDVKSAPSVRPEDVKSAPSVRPEDVKSAPSVRPEDVKSAPSVRPEDVKSAPPVRPEDVKSAPSVRPEDVKSAPSVRPEDVKSAPSVRPEDVKSAPSVRPEDVKSAPSVRPEDVKSAPSVRPEDVKSAPSVRPEDVKSAPSVRPEDVMSAPSVRPEDVMSAPSVRPEDVKSAPSVRPEDVKSAPSVRPEDVKSAPSVRPEDVKSAPSVRPEDVKSAPSVRPEDVKSAPSVRPEDVKSAPSVRPEDVKSAPSVRPEDVKSAPSVRPEDVKSAPSVRPEDVKSALAIGLEDVKSFKAERSEDVKRAPAIRPEDMKSAPAVRSEDVKSIQAIRPEDVKGAAVVRMEDVPSTPTIITEVTQITPHVQNTVVGDITPTPMNPTSQSQTSSLPAQPSLGWSSVSPVRVPDPLSPHRNMSSKPPLPIPPRSSLYPGHPFREQETSVSHETVSLSSFKSKAPAPDTLSYLDSVSLMSGTMESLTLLDDTSSIGSDSEINGMPYRKTDKYGFLGGNQFSGNGDTSIPVEIARQRELKWLEMFSNWDKWLTRRFQKVKLRCRKGIPSSLRAKAWQLLSNSHDLLMKNPGKFEEMERQQGDPKWLDVIEKDLHRQFPFHEMFAARGGHGQQDLYRILKAYTVYRPEEGYCQAQAPVAAVLLMHMPAEQAFWCLVQICDKYLPGYYSAGLEAIQLDGEIFFALLRRVCPMAYRHLKKFKIDPILYMTEWFMCIFSRTLPWASVLRVWDMFFCEGVKIVFRVGLVLLRHTLGSVDKLRSCQGMYETMEKLRSLPVHCMQEDVLLPEVSSVPVTDALIERESNTQLRKWRENRGELQYRPSRRLHGAKQIYEEKLRLNPTLSGSRLSLSSIRRPSPPPTPALAVQPESVVVSEGLHPALPSPTSNKTPLGLPKEVSKKGKEKQKEQEKIKEKEERELEKKREKEEREERRREKEREKQKEKEEKRVQKEREKTDSRQKRERKFSFRRKESSPASDSPQNSGPRATDSSAAHDTYF